jgi:hypothetical protein
MVTIRNLDCRLERVKAEYGECGACGMRTRHPREYHPYAACLMFEACHDAEKVRDNLEVVIAHAQAAGQREAA